jgi:hypothetical protein
MYFAAGELARCAEAEADATRRRALGDEAIGTLRRALEVGWSDAGRLARDPAFLAVRGRADFRALLDQLMDRSFPADPF